MDFSHLTLFKMIGTRMAYNAERQDVLARNVANADTPDFEPQDLESLDFENILASRTRKIELKRTSAMHLEPAQGMTENFDRKDVRDPYEKKIDGNKVNIEEQMSKIAQNSFEYQTATELYTKTAALFRDALGRS